MPYVSIDDKITRVLPDYTICETVDSVTREGFATKSAPGLTSLRHSGEGITWVRGWHLPDDEEVQAARVAASLDENKEQPSPMTLETFEKMLQQAAGTGYLLAPQPPPPAPVPWSGTPPYYAAAPSGVVTPTTTAPDPALTQFPFGKTTC